MFARQIALITGLLSMAYVSVANSTQKVDPTPDPTNGSLIIEAIQGSIDAPPIGVSDIEVTLLNKNKVIKTINSQLDEHGIAILNDIPLGTDIQPVVRVEHAGVTYQEVGLIMGASLEQQTIKVNCYEVTNETPSWTIPMWQIMLSHTPHGVKVTEILIVHNPDNQTWLGATRFQNKPVTMSLGLPSGADQIKLGTGFHYWCCTSIDSGSLINHLPLMPETTELNFSYIINSDDGTCELTLEAPADVEQMVVMLPDGIHSHTADGLALGGTRKIADTTVRYYTATELSKGNTVQLALSGLPRVRSVNSNSLPHSPVSINPNLLLMIAGGGVLLLATGSMLYRIRSHSAGSK